jgi:hypothetical protein
VVAKGKKDNEKRYNKKVHKKQKIPLFKNKLSRLK